MDSSKAKDSTSVPISSLDAESPRSSEDRDGSTEKQPEAKGKSAREHAKQCFGENLLTLATLLGVLLGLALGIGLRSARVWSKREAMYINFPGELFISMLKCLILPMITSSLVVAVGSLDIRFTGKIGLRAVIYYTCTTILAITLGIVLVISIKPGVGTEKAGKVTEILSRKSPLPEDGLMDLIRNLFPPNILEAGMKTQFLALKPPPERGNDTGNATNEEMREWEFEFEMGEGSNILGMVVISIVLGITLAVMEEKGRPLLDIFTCLFSAIMLIVHIVIWLTPIGVLFLVASKVLEVEDLTELVKKIGMLSVTVLVGIFFHGFFVLATIYFLVTRKNPCRFIFNMAQALATAFGTASSSATLPITINCLEEKNMVDPRVVRFITPIGATINMDGQALYEAVAAIFIAQMHEIPLDAGKVIGISIGATAASIGAAGIPQAGAFTILIVLNVVGLPTQDISMLLMIDWFLDRFRTVVNVLGDAFGAGIVAHISRKELERLDQEDRDAGKTESTLQS